LKRKSEAVLGALGMNLSEAITVFLRRVVATRGIPFPLIAERVELMGEEAAALESRARFAVQSAIEGRARNGLPVARYDSELGKPYLEHGDGSREYPFA
jgi:addiction module RelB/DinJ family antitoxin